MSNAPVIVRGQYSDLFDTTMLPVLEELYRSEVEQAVQIRERIFKTVPTDRDIWQYSELHDLPLHAEMAEGEEYSFFAPSQGFDKTLKILKFGLGASISEEAIDDGKFDLVAQIITQLARSAVESREVSAMNIFNNGFGSETTADGQPLFDQAHLLPGGITYRNELATPADLSVTSLETALTDFETEFVTDNGYILRIMPRILFVHPSNKRLAKELIGSDLKAETADNNMNSFKEEGLVVVSSPRLTDADAWFLLGSPNDTGLRIISRTGIQTKSEENFDTDSIKYKSRYREKIGAVHPLGVYGSPGAP